MLKKDLLKLLEKISDDTEIVMVNHYYNGSEDEFDMIDPIITHVLSEYKVSYPKSDIEIYERVYISDNTGLYHVDSHDLWCQSEVITRLTLDK